MSWWSELAKFRRHRPLSAAEHTWAAAVFGDTLPPGDRIRLSPALGRKRRPFTLPALGRRVTIFLGPDAADPVRTAPALFAHELTHVWQIAHAPHLLPWLVNAIATQLRFSMGTNVYDIGDGTSPWNEYGLEQQATVVEHWHADRDGPRGPETAALPRRRRPHRRPTAVAPDHDQPSRVAVMPPST